MKLQKRCIKAVRRQPNDDENINDDQKEDNGIHAAHGSTTSTDAKTSNHNGEQLESRPVTQTDVDQCSTDDKFDCVEGITADESLVGVVAWLITYSSGFPWFSCFYIVRYTISLILSFRATLLACAMDASAS